MTSIAVLLTDEESLNENILIKSIKYIKKSKLKKVYLIGDKKNFEMLYEKVKILKKINFIQIPLKNKNYKKYLRKITNEAIKLHNKKKISFLINMPLDKKKFLKPNYPGFTELFSNLVDKKKNENMLLFNKNFSVCPLTTHIELKNVEKNISKKKLIKCITNVLNFYKKIKKKFSIVVLGLNPHASKDFKKKTVDSEVLKPIVHYFKNKGVKICGPVSADTAFEKTKNKVFIGMYHDQVLVPFKMHNKFNGINITIGKKIIRMSPDHGTGKNIINKKNLINNQSFIKCIQFCENN